MSGGTSVDPVSIELQCPEDKMVHVSKVTAVKIGTQSAPEGDSLTRTLTENLKAKCRTESHCVYSGNEYSSCEGPAGDGLYQHLYVVYSCTRNSITYLFQPFSRSLNKDI